MRALAAVILDLLREAMERRWFLALGVAITGVLVVLGLSLRLDVVDGALAATRFFGRPLGTDIQAVDVALRPVYEAAAYIVFYGGLLFGVLACSDFAPSLLAAGRIELLLSLPLRRWQLLVGTFLGVLLLGTLGGLYGAGGLTLLLGIKTGYWTLRPLLTALVGAAAFASVYGVMLTVAVFARSAALSSATGLLVFVAGVVAGFRQELLELYSPGLGRQVFAALTLPLPRISRLAKLSARLATAQAVDGALLARLVLAAVVFGVAALLVGVWRLERRDF